MRTRHPLVLAQCDAQDLDLIAGEHVVQQHVPVVVVARELFLCEFHGSLRMDLVGRMW